MAVLGGDTLLALLSGHRAPGLALALAFLVGSSVLIYAGLGRWGRHNALTKCAVLSVWVHIMLLVGAYLTNGVSGPIGRSGSGTRELHVRWIAEESAESVNDTHDIAAELLETPVELEEATPQRLTEEASPPANAASERATDEVPLRRDTDLPADDRDVADTAPAELSAVTDDTAPVPPGHVPPESSHLAVAAPAVDPANAIEPQPATEVAPSLAGDPVVNAEDREPQGPAAWDAAELLASTDIDAPLESVPEDTPIEAAQVAPVDLVLRSRSPDPTQVHRQASSNTDAFRHAAAGSSLPALRPYGPTSVSVPQKYRGRELSQRRELAAAHGGSADTEAAVEAALVWLASAQSKSDGRWETGRWGGGRETRELVGDVRSGVQADSAATGLALLAFLGAGYTHVEGPYRDEVRRGLEYLLAVQATDTGSLAGNASRYVAMYSHGIATLALSEALIMSGDAQLRPAVERAVQYTVSCQHPVTGGWRYQRGDQGDTSQFGWQLMSLVSAQVAGVRVSEQTLDRAEGWLDRVSLGSAGGLACYVPERRVASPSMTAEAMVCRTFVGRRAASAADEEAADYIAQQAMRGGATRDLYFSYYATLALYPLQDERWHRWNQQLTQTLLAQQRASGVLQGSWDTDTRWGPTGGRVYTTAMACLCLETYYRYLPVYELAMDRSRTHRR